MGYKTNLGPPSPNSHTSTSNLLGSSKLTDQLKLRECCVSIVKLNSVQIQDTIAQIHDRDLNLTKETFKDRASNSPNFKYLLFSKTEKKLFLNRDLR